MRPLDRLWRALGSRPTLEGVVHDWKEAIGPEFDVAKRFLRPTDRRASSWSCPSPGGDGCPRQVVIHGPGDVVAVCGEVPKRCDDILLTEQDLIIHEFHVPSLCVEVVHALGLEGAVEEVGSLSRTWHLGSISSQPGGRSAVYLMLPPETKDLCRTAAELALRASTGLLLLVPSEKECSHQAVEILQRRQGSLRALEGVLADENGRLVQVADTDDLLPAKERDEAPSKENVFRREGTEWLVTFQGKTFPLKHRKGLAYLVVLLREPGREFHPAELPVETGELPHLSPTPLPADCGLSFKGLGSTGSLLDQRATREYRDRLREIDQELQEAERNNDIGTAETLRKEREMIRDQLKSAFGLQGRPRHENDLRKRKRDRVTKALKRSVESIRKAHPGLGAHLNESLRHGASWSYRPKSPIDWKV